VKRFLCLLCALPGLALVLLAVGVFFLGYCWLAGVARLFGLPLPKPNLD
jgi:hypothetical protein